MSRDALLAWAETISIATNDLLASLRTADVLSEVSDPISGKRINENNDESQPQSKAYAPEE